MRTLTTRSFRQRGAASLLTAVILLICITLVTLLVSKTVLMETKIAADNYRIGQAVGAADYAMDFGVNYFDSGGFDQDNDGTSDNIHLFDADGDGTNDEIRLTSADVSQTTFATVAFDRTAAQCLPPGGAPSWSGGIITAVGVSDDRAATRTVTQCVGPLDVVRDDGPDQPLVAQGHVVLTGNASIINRYTNTTIWTGGNVVIGSSSSMSTYIKSSGAGALTEAQLTDTDPTVNAQLVSNRNLGNGLDIIDDDPSLGSLTGLDFFKNFFLVSSRAEFKQLAQDIGQVYTDINDATDSDGVIKSGPIWIDPPTGTASLTGNQIGSLTKPAVVVVNGNLQTSGNPNVFGIIYVIGKYDVGGTVDVIGANIVEGTNVATGNPATPPIVSGNGTLNLVYWPAFGGSGGNPDPGLTAVVSGSWRDWQ